MMTGAVVPHRPPVCRRRDIALLVCLAGLSGAALVAQIVWSIDMLWTAGFVALPGSIALVVIAFVGRGRRASLRVLSDRVIVGATAGLVATVAYDVVRPLLVWALRLHINPYRAHPIFGSLITGHPRTSATAIGVGWAYHVWNGISFGVMLALVRPRGGWVAGMIWALVLQGLMMAMYPNLLGVRLDDPAFMASTVTGHALYGVVLGTWLQRRGTQ